MLSAGCVTFATLFMFAYLNSAEGITCLDLKKQNSKLPSGEYEIMTCSSGILLTVYCEMGLNGGGYTFLQSEDLYLLTDADIQAMITDRTTVLVRAFTDYGEQPYGVLRQLPANGGTPIKWSLNSRPPGFSPTQNAVTMGAPYLYIGFQNTVQAQSNGDHGLTLNNRTLQITTKIHSSYPNSFSYLALFQNFGEQMPLTTGFNVNATFCKKFFQYMPSNPSRRCMPCEYYTFGEFRMGDPDNGCWMLTDDNTLETHAVQSIAAGFR